MRSWVRSLKLFALLAALATPAVATPPQIVWVKDQLFAISATQVLILRTISDNHGYHQTEQTDTFLIVRDLATGQDISINAVERVVANSVIDVDITHYPLDNVVNPYAVRQELNAAPLSDPRRFHLNVEIYDDAVRASDHEGVTHYARWSDIFPSIFASLQSTRDLLPILKMEGGFDALDLDGFLHPVGCEVVAAANTRYISTIDTMLVQLACEDEEVGARHLIWFVLPAA
ncbi:MAG TPA: hypothetical protein DIT67_00720 [Octadecabacter sp.]|nr:hypothetical protein [Octadecabacter sp.]